MNAEYITIAEYAQIKGISKQAVYKQLNNKLKDFVQLVEGRKALSLAALSPDEIAKFNQGEQPVEQQENNQIQPVLEILGRQLEEKDRTIQSLLEQIERLQAQNETLTELAKSSQVLLAAEKKLLPDQTAPKESEKKKIWGFFKKNR